MNQIIKRMGVWWLSWPKWAVSRWLAGPEWDTPILLALARRSPYKAAELAIASTLEEVVDAFRGIVHWMPDPGGQVWDQVLPPALLLRQGGDDCDGMAMLHAQAIAYALGPRGWRAAIGSYLADPWELSHHVALTVDPDGLIWAVQPQPTMEQPQDARLIFGPYINCEIAMDAIASQYHAKVVWYDIRMPDGSPAPLDYLHHAPANPAGVSS